MKGSACWVILFSALVLIGCARYPVNPPLDHVDAAKGYRFQNLFPGEKNTDDVFIIVSLSGGGTRAASLAYGVLQTLRGVRIGGDEKTLLDEVDAMTAVSTSSVVAAYYGLYGEEAFFRDFKEEFLYRKIQRALILRTLAPWHWPRLLSPYFGRSDLAEEYLDHRLFRGHTYGDMLKRRPFIVLNATDMSLGAQFSFTQGHFDRLCSDLSQVHISRAVTASLAFSVAFTPLTLKNYPKSQCGYTRPTWVEEALEEELDVSSRRYDRAKNWITYEGTEQRPYIHLFDGGISDNIGIRAAAIAFMTRDTPWSLIDRLSDGRIKRLVVIIVDAKTEGTFKRDRRAKPPGIPSVLVASAGNPMANYSTETVKTLRDYFSHFAETAESFEGRRKGCEELAARLCRDSSSKMSCQRELRRECYAKMYATESDRPPNPELYLIHVRFEVIDDEDLRRRLQTMPTSLQLPRDDVDLLVREAPTILEESEDYQRLLRDLGAE
jgi:NTE family protein